MVRKALAAVAGLLGAVGLLVAGSAHGAGSLIVNGSFEDSPAVQAYLNIVGGGSSIKGWTVTGEGIDLVASAYWQSSDSIRSLDLDGSARSRATPPFCHGGVAQTFATKPGTGYMVTFDMAGNPARAPIQKPMRVSAAGQSMEFKFDITRKGFRDMGWLPMSWAFTANADSTTLEFTSLTVPPQTGFGPAIDNVAVIPLDRHQPVEITENAKEIQIKLGAEVLFDTGKFALKPAATEALEKVAALLKDHAGLPIVIEGHTDSVGKPGANQALSEKRADAVREWLIANGDISGDLITTKGYGQTQPVAGNDTAEGRQKNRRVEIRLQK